MAASAQIVELQQLLQQKGLGRALPKAQSPDFEPATTGIPYLDAQLNGGLPRGRISEITGPSSSGRTSLAFNILATAGEREEVMAYIDATDSFDPRSAQQFDIDFERLLWVRCNVDKQPRYRQLALKRQQADEAWQALNLVASAGGFGVIILDLADLPLKKLRRWQAQQWRRVIRSIENTATALVILTEAHLTGSSASVVLELNRNSTQVRLSRG